MLCEDRQQHLACWVVFLRPQRRRHHWSAWDWYGLSLSQFFAFLTYAIPITGKTLFQLYFLIHLLQRKQSVLFSWNGDEVFLFHLGKAYHAPNVTQMSAEFLPRPRAPVFLWSLFDVYAPVPPAPIFVRTGFHPVQTASPDPRRYKDWRKEKLAITIGFPSWTEEELFQG